MAVSELTKLCYYSMIMGGATTPDLHFDPVILRGDRTPKEKHNHIPYPPRHLTEEEFFGLWEQYKTYIRAGFKTLGRNDKCLCGSGKKYKQCCNQSEREFLKFDHLDSTLLNDDRIIDYFLTNSKISDPNRFTNEKEVRTILF